MAHPWLDQLLVASREDREGSERERVQGAHRATRLVEGAAPDDAALVRALQSADEMEARRAFETIFTQYTATLYAITAAVLRSSDPARDVVQDVMLRLWDRRSAFAPRGPIRGYLSSAAYNAARDAVKAHVRLRAREESHAADARVHSPYAVIGDVDDDASRVNAAVLALPGRTGELFRLWWNGLSYADVATTAGITVKGVERARARALEQLAVSLADLAPSPKTPTK
jgi:RNA polymerase sigma factor (sigma-70 family)